MTVFKRFSLKIIVLFYVFALLSACGGGGSSGPVFNPDVAPRNVQVIAGEDGFGNGVMNVISWTLDPAATDYLVYWDTVPLVTETSAVVNPTLRGNNYVVHSGTDVVPGTTYYYRVQALSGSQSSILSETVVGIPQQTIVATNLNDVSWNGVDTLVVVGDSGVIIHSPSGTFDPWVEASVNPTSESLSAVTWDAINSRFLIVGAGGTVLTGDGDNWNLETTPVDADLEDVAWIGDRYVVVGKNGTIITSLDGSVWTEQDSPPNVTTLTLNGVESDGNRIVAVGTNGMMLVSDDGGINWVELDKLTNNDLTDVSWDGSHFGVVGSDGTVMSSPDGINWTEHTEVHLDVAFIGATQWDAGIPVDPILAAVGASGVFAIITDAGALNVRTATNEQLSAISWVDDQDTPYFIIVGHNGTVFTNQQYNP